MLLSLLLAAAVQAAPPPSMAAFPGRVTFYASKDEALEAARKAAACRDKGLVLADQPSPNLQSKVQRLGDLPPANHTLTVLRSVDGCPVSSTIRYNVDRPARRR
jgi:hypothetical protein